MEYLHPHKSHVSFAYKELKNKIKQLKWLWNVILRSNHEETSKKPLKRNFKSVNLIKKNEDLWSVPDKRVLKIYDSQVQYSTLYWAWEILQSKILQQKKGTVWRHSINVLD